MHNFLLSIPSSTRSYILWYTTGKLGNLMRLLIILVILDPIIWLMKNLTKLNHNDVSETFFLYSVRLLKKFTRTLLLIYIQVTEYTASLLYQFYLFTLNWTELYAYKSCKTFNVARTSFVFSVTAVHLIRNLLLLHILYSMELYFFT